MTLDDPIEGPGRDHAADQEQPREGETKAAETEGEDLEHIETFAKTFAIGEVVAVAVQADE